MCTPSETQGPIKTHVRGPRKPRPRLSNVENGSAVPKGKLPTVSDTKVRTHTHKTRTNETQTRRGLNNGENDTKRLVNTHISNGREHAKTKTKEMKRGTERRYRGETLDRQLNKE